MLPQDWEKKLVDMNVTDLKNKDIIWADYVFISAMAIQKDSAKNIIRQCKSLDTKIVAGGPLFTTEYQEFDEVEHLVLNEAEITLPLFLEDLNNGCAKHLYMTDEHPDIRITPIPLWELINMKKYYIMSIEYSRGCPFDCEYCDIVMLNGHVPRTKARDQILRELEALHDNGWRNEVLIVDDNFIGNTRKLKTEILPAMVEWMKKNRFPFLFAAEASINISDDEELIQLMVDSNFHGVFVGIETTNEESLTECGKFQNKNRDMVASVKKLQSRGLQVYGSFIIGFDNDPQTIFASQIDFIQRSGIVVAMVNLLNAPTGTKLYKRLKAENRLLGKYSGDTNNYTMNFIPKMDYKTLITGYKRVIDTIYSFVPFYDRIEAYLREFKQGQDKARSPRLLQFRGLAKSMWFIGLKEKGRRHYWKLLFQTLLRYPRLFPLAVTLSIYGFHFRKVLETYAKAQF